MPFYLIFPKGLYHAGNVRIVTFFFFSFNKLKKQKQRVQFSVMIFNNALNLEYPLHVLSIVYFKNLLRDNA